MCFVPQAQPLDVEELAQLGSDLGVCPYYGSRAAIAEAEVGCVVCGQSRAGWMGFSPAVFHSVQVITMPYSMLLNKHTRESIGLKLSKCVVVVDEGHNLVDAINSSHSASLGERQVKSRRCQPPCCMFVTCCGCLRRRMPTVP